MIAVYQTKFPIKDADGNAIQYGNCMQAAFASLFELELNQVPNFIEMPPNPSHCHYNMVKFAGALGFDLMYRQGDNYSYESYYLAFGDTCRGTSHMVVYRDGRLSHDPHPDHSGLIKVRGTYVAIPYNPGNFDYKSKLPAVNDHQSRLDF